jgi:hypothetical protein
MDKDVLSKKKALLFAQEVVQKWKGYDDDVAKADKFLQQNKRFDKAWSKFDKSKA